jgi:AcrR family transcriptional regulator
MDTLVTDGRNARRDRNRTAVLDAVIELFGEGHVDPDPELVAARVGLSSRSVYRYFDDREALLRAAIDRQLERTRPLYRIHAIGEGSLTERIERFVTARLQLYDAIAATSRAARRRAPVNAVIREQVDATRRALRQQVDLQFAAELASFAPRRAQAVAAAIDTLCQPESLDNYRVHRGSSSATTSALLVEALHALLDHP